MAGDLNNNQMMSINESTIRLRRGVRGLKKEDLPILAGLQIYHNHALPHLDLSGNGTPAGSPVSTPESTIKHSL